jgi:hypothetical protein
VSYITGHVLSGCNLQTGHTDAYRDSFEGCISDVDSKMYALTTDEDGDDAESIINHQHVIFNI